MAEEWQSRSAQGYKTFADLVEDTVQAWVKRRDARTKGSDKIDPSTQPPSEKTSNYSCACCTLRGSLQDREATAHYFSAFLLTAAPHTLLEAKTEESPCVSKIAEDSSHRVSHRNGPEQIVLDLARFLEIRYLRASS